MLIEDNELSFTGDDPIGLWPVSEQAKANPNDCQRNIVVRNNTARWPRQFPGQKAGLNGTFARDQPSCNISTCCNHFCFATYAAGEGVAFLGNRCEGARDVIAFNGGYPNASQSQWCGKLVVAGNSYAEYPGQGQGCRLNSDTSSMCSHYLPPPGVLGGQCSKAEALLPPPCDNRAMFDTCKNTPGVAAICFNGDAGPVQCVTASKLAQSDQALCPGYSKKCTIFDGGARARLWTIKCDDSSSWTQRTKWSVLHLLLSASVTTACLPGEQSCDHPSSNDKLPAGHYCCGTPTGPKPQAQPVNVSVNPANVTHSVNPLFNGCHSDSGYAHQARGLYSQMVLDESFEDLNLTNAQTHDNPWRLYATESASANQSAWIDSAVAFHGHSSLGLRYSDGDGLFGLANRGLGHEGLVFRADREYEGFFFASAAEPVTFTLAIVDYTTGAQLGTDSVHYQGGSGWSRLNFTLKSNATTICVDANRSQVDCGPGNQPCVQCGGEFVIGLSEPGHAHVDYIFLEPGAWGRYEGLSVLASAATALKTMGIKVIRLGGSFDRDPSQAWKNWRGPAWLRPSLGDSWRAAYISGWGPFEMAALCLKLGIEMMMTTWGGMKPEDYADLVEYVMG